MNRSPLARTLLASAAIVAAVMLAGCDTDGTSISGRALAPIPDKTLAEMTQKNMAKESPILIRLFKEEAELEVWKQDSSGKFALLKTFPICRWSGELGPKIKEGDRQAPEGFYTITPAQMNPTSQYFLAFNMGFPNAYDQANGRTGNFLMIHGDCSSRGCYAMTDEQISEIYALARESFFGGQESFQVQAYPFRMTPANLAKHRTNPNMAFWKMLKEGNDHFEVTKAEPKIDVCERRYVFDAAAPDGASTALKFNPRAQCPAFEVPDDIVAAAGEKQRRDEIEMAALIRRGMPVAPITTGTDGGMHEVFVAALNGGLPVADKDGSMARMIPVSAPGTIPPTVNPPGGVTINPPTQMALAAPAETETVASNVPLPRAAPSVLGRIPAQTTVAAAPAPRNFLGSLFASAGPEATSSSPSAPAPAAPAVAFQAPSTTAAPKSAVPAALPQAPKPAVAAKPVPLIASATQPKPQPLVERIEPPATVANAGAIRPQAQPVQAATKTAEAVPVTAARASLLSGAAPVVPTGSFGTNWSALR